ncbi:pole-organizing protein PopZ [Pontixanthobacter gangjinensis]|uniref:DUF2497 domain-containing protein n=1 Tax=Pontixanthobacter gangjinensis TaxID=1028742 RepID=A0A6I4SJ89_9SPHN|nr:DUF2497 domain-containing protein [Pontixanthobacter gangjinensis]MXO55725.1 DUF2497 domain-containing protein [Pontixanthobacter gangjinensis]
MREQNESSVEEILESIKKVIARDNRTGAVIERRKREEEGVVETKPEAKSESAEDDSDRILELSTAELIEEAPDEELGDEKVPLITEKARDSMRDNLAALAMLAEPGVPPQIVRSGETSLEGLVRDLLRPMLSEWLDENLPGMVEKMVKDEISRIAGKRG